MRMQLYNSGLSPVLSVINLGRINNLFKTAYIVVSPQLTILGSLWIADAVCKWVRCPRC